MITWIAVWIVAAIVCCLILLVRPSWVLNRHTKHYAKLRDKLTLKKRQTLPDIEEPIENEEEEEEEVEFKPISLVGKLLGFCISLFVFDEVLNEMGKIAADVNNTSGLDSIITSVTNLFPMVAMLGMLGIIVGAVLPFIEDKESNKNIEHYKENRDKLTHKERQSLNTKKKDSKKRPPKKGGGSPNIPMVAAITVASG